MTEKINLKDLTFGIASTGKLRSWKNEVGVLERERRMRPIKFRAWDGEHKEMYEWKQYKSELVAEDFESKFLKLMQYTGLKDKNGVEIYEGDILLGYCVYPECDIFEPSLIGEVYYSSRGTWDCYSYILGGFNEQVEVIGNIYETPEFLKEQIELG